MITRLVLLCAVLVTSSAAAKPTCKGNTACPLGDRSYHVLEPDGWNGSDPLPVLMHFHGWARQGDLIVKHQRIAGATRRRGVLLIAPNGLGKSWDFWRNGGRDTPFARAVLHDVKARYPVKEDAIYVSGYSYGSRMAWRFVCEDGADIASLLGIAGALDEGEVCATAPREVRQVYGLKDTVLTPSRDADGSLGETVRLWRETYSCSGKRGNGPWNAEPFLTLTNTTWDCESGRVSLDTHPGGHFIPHGWIAKQLDELAGRPFSYP